MESILFLPHRLPFPPEKGDKVRSNHLLKFLASRYRVHLGTFVDDSNDLRHVSRLSEFCASFKVVRIRPTQARVRSLSGLWTGDALTVSYYRDASLMDWVRTTIHEQRIDKVVVFSAAMAQYVAQIPRLCVIVDFVDVDSEKWKQYGRTHRWPLSTVFEREAKHLLAYERSVAARSHASIFVTANEAELFCKLAPECAARVQYVQNGVDTQYFLPQGERPTPYGPDEEPIVFTGAMDYWPNIDAVCWFARAVLPSIILERPRARFYIVGMRPTTPVRALGRHSRVVVTGRVSDVRPYLQHARVVVAPLRIARGMQNKVLEAMAMARPVVLSPGAAVGLSATNGVEMEVAEDAFEFSRKTIALMDPTRGAKVGMAARARMINHYDWPVNLAPFATLLQGAVAMVGEDASGSSCDSRFLSTVAQ